MTLEQLNTLPEDEALAVFRDCCAADAWARPMVAARPYHSAEALHGTARALWPNLHEADWLVAFEAHPKIGDIKSLKAKYASTEALASGEQAGARVAPDAVLQRLKDGNEAYLHKFGFIFIVCATGKSAEQMLELLEQRLPNSREQELRIAAEERIAIKGRQRQIFSQAAWQIRVGDKRASKGHSIGIAAVDSGVGHVWCVTTCDEDRP